MSSITLVIDPKTAPKRVTLHRHENNGVRNDRNELIYTSTETAYPNVGNLLLRVEDLSTGKYSMSNFIKRPIIHIPEHNSTNYTGTVRISRFAASPTYRGNHTKTIVELAADPNFIQIIRRISTTTDIEDTILAPTTSKSHNYLRVRHESGPHKSLWSNVHKIQVAQLEYIRKPTILEPINNSNGHKIRHLVLRTSPYQLVGATDASHEYTEFEISQTADFRVITHTGRFRTNLTNNIIQGMVLEYDTEYYIRIRYKGTKYEVSEWSDTVKFTTQVNKVEPGIDGLINKIVGDDVEGSYYGELATSKLIAPNYRGEYNSKIKYRPGMIVRVDTKEYISKTINTGQPVTNTTHWEEWTQDYLPTTTWLLDQLGISYGRTDENIDSLSSDNVAIGNKVDTTWLKFGYDERILYIPKRVIVNNISYNDLAKSYITTKKRTIRIGTRLYYIRLLTEEEFRNTLVKLTNGVLGQINPNDLEINKNIWIYDSNPINIKKVIRHNSVVGSVNSRSRDSVGFRPVLELIKLGEEPYREFDPDLPKVTNEYFRYDNDTDTGYFGLVDNEALLGNKNLATHIGLNAGVAQNLDTKWMKFYWHGYVVYIAQKSIRHSLLKDDLLSLNAVHGIHLGNAINKSIDVGNKKLYIGIPKGTGFTIPNTIQSSGTPTSTLNFDLNTALEIGKGSMWNELIYRVHGTYVNNDIADQDTINYMEMHGGVQIGNNWEAMSTSELNIAEGNGSNTLCQEIFNGNVQETVSRGYYFLPGIVRQNFNQRLPIFGWRPILIEGDDI